METTKFKGLLLLTALFFSGTFANAQGSTTTTTTSTTTSTVTEPNYDQGFRLGFGLNGGYMLDENSIGNNDDAFSGLALGVDARLQYDLSKRLSVTLTTGYNHFFIEDDIKDIPFANFKDVGMIPVKAGFKAFFWEDQFYGLAEAGAGFVVTKNSPVSDDTSLILSPGIGWASKYIDLSVRYEHYSEFKTGQVALRLAYGFRL
ncbi:MAG TPA: hypothetical protein VK528_01920 [Flavobacterium sp.]|nr:hypothetical protein [Flavobacterium sp.]